MSSKLSILLVSLILLIFIGCNQPKGRLQEVVEYYDTGNIKTRHYLLDSVFDSLYLYYYPSGQLHSYIEYDSGVENGLFMKYNENGNLSLLGYFKDGLMDSISIRYYPNGKIESLISEIKKGKIVGDVYQFSDSGWLSEYFFYYPADSQMFYQEYNSEKKILRTGGGVAAVNRPKKFYSIGDTLECQVTVANVPYIRKIGLLSISHSNEKDIFDTLKESTWLVILKKLDEPGKYHFKIRHLFIDSVRNRIDTVESSNFNFTVKEKEI